MPDLNWTNEVILIPDEKRNKIDHALYLAIQHCLERDIVKPMDTISEDVCLILNAPDREDWTEWTA